MISWAQHGKGAQNTYGDGIAHDNSGGIYVTGDFRDSIRFGTLKITESSFGSPYCAKFDTLGNPIWLKKDIGGEGIVFDGNANLYAFTSFNQTLKKIDLNGNVIWTKNTYTSSIFGSNGINGVVANGTDVYVTGHYSGDAYFDNDTIYNVNASSANWDIFVAKFSASNGANVWAKTAGGKGLDKGYALYMNASNELYNVGYFRDTAMFASTQLIGKGNADTYISKYDLNGNLIWVKGYGGTGFDLSNAIVGDASGNLYTMGRFSNTIAFGTNTITGASVNSYINKFDASGNPIWAKAIAGGEEGSLNYVSNRLGFSVSSGGPVTIGTITAASLGGTDICVGELDVNGNPYWFKLYGGSSNDEGSAMLQYNGSVYFAGSFNNTASFDSYSFTSMASWDVVVAKLNSSLTAGLAEGQAGNVNIKVYPIPAIFTLNVSSDKEIVSTELYDVSGKLILQSNNRDNNYNLNVSELENGIYLLKVVSKDGYIRSNRIVISK